MWSSIRHLIDFGNLTREERDSLYARASQIMDTPERFADICRGKVAASLSYEPSTRTNFSFQTAMLRLGGTVFGFADLNSSSVVKGKTLKDTVKMGSSYVDLVVMRTPWEGSAKAASLYSYVPVINAGDSGHMPPTQTQPYLPPWFASLAEWTAVVSVAQSFYKESVFRTGRHAPSFFCASSSFFQKRVDIFADSCYYRQADVR